MKRDILQRITEKTRGIIAHELGVNAEFLTVTPPKGRTLEWTNAADDRDEARCMAEYFSLKFDEPLAET